jgi:hypothetical protein
MVYPVLMLVTIVWESDIMDLKWAFLGQETGINTSLSLPVPCCSLVHMQVIRKSLPDLTLLSASPNLIIDTARIKLPFLLV